MDNKLFEDDMKDMKPLLIVFLCIGILGIICIILSQCVPWMNQDSDDIIIIAGILIGIIFVCSFYSLLDVLTYKLEVYDDKIYVRSLFSKKTIMFAGEVKYICKKLNWKYSMFIITVGDKKIVVKTKKAMELKDILNQISRVQI